MEDQVCELCGEDDDPLDPITEFIDPFETNELCRVIAHAQCGVDQNLRMA